MRKKSMGGMAIMEYPWRSSVYGHEQNLRGGDNPGVGTPAPYFH